MTDLIIHESEITRASLINRTMQNLQTNIFVFKIIYP